MSVENVTGTEEQSIDPAWDGLREVVGDVFGLDGGTIDSLQKGTSLEEGLEADSLKIIEAVEALEEKFGVVFDDGRLENVRNLGDLHYVLQEVLAEN